MSKYELRLLGHLERHTTLHGSSTLGCGATIALYVYVREPRRSNKAIPVLLKALNNWLQQATKHEMIDVNDFMTCMTND